MNLLLIVSVVVGVVGCAPAFQERDVELVDMEDLVDAAEVMIESSIIPFQAPVGDSDGADGAHFFWSGSGDDPDAGMTYWITTTLYRTSVITLAPAASTGETTTALTTTTTTSTTPLIDVTMWPLDCTSHIIQPTPTLDVAVMRTQYPFSGGGGGGGGGGSSAGDSEFGTTPATPAGSDHVTQMFRGGDIGPEYWLRTVLRADVRDASLFRREIEIRLQRVYAMALAEYPTAAAAAAPLKRRDRRQATNSSNQSTVKILLQNVSRSDADADDVHVIYAVSKGEQSNRQLIDPAVAVGYIYRFGRDNLTLHLCYDPVNATKDLCYDVITHAEPYIQSVVMAAPRYWIIGVVIGAILLSIVTASVLYIALCKCSKKGKTDDDADVDGRSRVTTDATGAGAPSSSLLAGSSWIPAGSLTLSDPAHSDVIIKSNAAPAPLHDYWVRKSQSTSQKRRRRRGRRPKTAPQLLLHAGQRSRSSSSLSVTSSVSSERNEYLPSSQEPLQASRSCRLLKNKDKKKKKKSKDRLTPIGSSSVEECSTDPGGDSREAMDCQQAARNVQGLSVTHLDVVEDVDDGQGSQPMLVAPIPLPRKFFADPSQMEFQEVTTDFTGADDNNVPGSVGGGDSDDDANGDPTKDCQDDDSCHSSNTSEAARWRPGSLIPARITGSIFGSNSRRIASAPAVRPLLISDNSYLSRIDLTESPKKGHVSAWTSTEPIPQPVRVDRATSAGSMTPVQPIVTLSESVSSSKDRVPLHVHSLSYPAWPSLSESDPAIDLIRAIKDELKKFDPDSQH